MDIPFGRELKLGSMGNDVLAVKRSLARAGFGPGKLNTLTPIFGPFTVIFLKRFQKKNKLIVDGIYGQASHEKLISFFDSYSRKLYLGVHKYVNPFEKCTGLVPARTDQGVDYFADAGSPILALGDGYISRSTTNSGWAGGGCVQLVLTANGPYKGEEHYVAEFIEPLVNFNQKVKAGQVIAKFTRSASSGVGIEYGFNKPGTFEPCNICQPSDADCQPTEGGIRMNRKLRKLGCKVRDDFGSGPDTSPCGVH